MKKASKKYNYVIGSGWWCSGENERTINPSRKLVGDDQIRSADFFPLWLNSIRQHTKPASIIIIDSNAPVKPPPPLRNTVNWVELPFNAKHATEHLGQWSGWTRSVLLSGHYALNTDADYFVYIEQDCLLQGNGIVDYCISVMTKDLMFGPGDGTPQPLQQSFFIVRRRSLRRFLNNLASLCATDRDLPPEWKFIFSCWRPMVLGANLGIWKRRSIRRVAHRVARCFFYDPLPIGSGRARPIPTNNAYYYFQHGTTEDIEAYLNNGNQKN